MLPCVADYAILWSGRSHGCPLPVWAPLTSWKRTFGAVGDVLGTVDTQANEMCDYPAGRRFQPLTLALDNLTDCGTGACVMHHCTCRQLACCVG